MPIFIDGHKMAGINVSKLKKIMSSSPDKHGVTHKDILYNKKENKMFCILEAPNKKAILNHHNDFGIICDFIIEATSIQTETLQRVERLRAIGELSARVAHDLRNPLGVIKNAIELIEMSANDQMDEKLKKRIFMIKKASDKMSRQITDVLDFTRTRELQLEKTSLKNILESSLSSLTTQPEKISKPKNDILINCDGKQLEIVFANIITNAIQATNNSSEIKVRFSENKNEVCIEIEDSGPGIPEDKLDQIFDPLFTTKSSGTGLGLVSCKNIVEQHQGTISIRNNPTVFEIRIPKKIRI
ncbi:MAG: nickel-binding protein [Nitrosopumilaceae archaeon]